MTSVNAKPELPIGWYALLCIAGAELGRLVSLPAGDVALPVFWPPTGLLAAALVLTASSGLAFQATTAAVTLLSAAAHGQPLSIAAALTVLSVVDATVIAAVIRRVIREPLSSRRLVHMWTLALAGSAVPMVVALPVAAMLNMLHGIAWTAAWRACWLPETIGVLQIAPLVCALWERRAFIIDKWRSSYALETLCAIGIGMALTEGVFGERLSPLLQVPAYVMPALLWPAFRSGPAASAAMVLGVCLVGMWHTSHGHGPFALESASLEEWIVRSQGSVIVVSISFAMLAAIVAERKDAASERARLVAELQKALVEIKTLRGFIPICAWCHKVRDDAGFWQQLETYLGRHTDATFSHAICPACETEARAEIESHRDPSDDSATNVQ